MIKDIEELNRITNPRERTEALKKYHVWAEEEKIKDMERL